MAAESDRPTKAKKKKYFVWFNKGWATKYNCVTKSRTGERFAFCTTCAKDFGIGYGGENDISRHLETRKHKTKQNKKSIQLGERKKLGFKYILAHK